MLERLRAAEIKPTDLDQILHAHDRDQCGDERAARAAR